ncbi:hypothetical protein HAD_07945 [Hyphomonas adhaerens MHS-3]|uniref:Uncharacterized protein n=1 Tax=Hyphomonas adhaerens MHS-3 TaxID=1280949 RepID=A0A069E5N1_9PROT|nr:hypothetical protein HAD_07945 [Hyphomonas adhaerens MHS-3]
MNSFSCTLDPQLLKTFYKGVPNGCRVFAWSYYYSINKLLEIKTFEIAILRGERELINTLRYSPD